MKDCTCVNNSSTSQSAEPIVGPVKDSVVKSGKGCSVELARGINAYNSRWYEVIDLSHEDTAALEEDLVQIACQESVSQQSSLPAQSQSAHHNVRSSTKDANTTTSKDGVSTVHSLREAPVSENIHKEVQSSEQETPEEEILLALFNSMSEDITTSLPTELTIPIIPGTSSSANPSYTPFAFDTHSSDHSNIAGRSLYGGLSGFGTVSTLGSAGSDAASRGVHNSDATARTTAGVMTGARAGARTGARAGAKAGARAGIRTTRSTLSSDEAAVAVYGIAGLERTSSGMACNAPTQSSDSTGAATVSMNPGQELPSTRSLFNPGGPFRFV